MSVFLIFPGTGLSADEVSYGVDILLKRVPPRPAVFRQDDAAVDFGDDASADPGGMFEVGTIV